MKTFVAYVVILLALVGGAAAVLYATLIKSGDPGYVIFGHGQWAVETSLLAMIGFMALGFTLLYVALRLIAHTVNLPRTLQQRGAIKRMKRSQEALLVGLYESAQGNWEKAEKTLIRHAANSGAPLIHYLTAARAASSRGAKEQRDEYLRVAAETMPEAELAVGLTRAELLMSEQQFDEALKHLTELDQIAPTHATVLKMMHRVYAQLGDWEGLHALLPRLHNGKVLLEAEIKLLETETFSALLKQKAQLKDPGALKDLWKQVPRHIRAVMGVRTVYFAAMIEAGAGPEIEADLREALGKEWDHTLVVLYGCIRLTANQAGAQIRHLERFADRRPHDAVLQRVLGRVCLRNDDLDGAERHLKRSVELEPTVEAYHLLGETLSKKGDKATASDYYRSGLLLASSEVVQQVEARPEESLPSPEYFAQEEPSS